MSMAGSRMPFRWNLVTPDELGSLLTDTSTPDLWFLGDLLACAGKVLARSRNGGLVFVGRSLDSMFDLLSGALASDSGRVLWRLPLSFQRAAGGAGRRWHIQFDPQSRRTMGRPPRTQR